MVGSIEGRRLAIMVFPGPSFWTELFRKSIYQEVMDEMVWTEREVATPIVVAIILGTLNIVTGTGYLFYLFWVFLKAFLE